MPDYEFSELFVEIITWAVAMGAVNITAQPGLWRGEAGEWKVAINPHREDIDDVPYGHIHLDHKTCFRLAIVSPKGGACFGVTEEHLLAHFRQARLIAEDK